MTKCILYFSLKFIYNQINYVSLFIGEVEVKQKMYYDNFNNNNDIGFSNDIGFDDNTYYNNNPPFDDNNIEYLDSFYNDCINNKDIHNTIIRKKRIKLNIGNIIAAICAIVSFFMIGIGAQLDEHYYGRVLVTIGVTGFIAAIMSRIIADIISTPNKKQKKHSSNNQEPTDNIHYDYLDEYLKLENLNNFSDEKPRCLTLPNTYYDDKPEDVSLVLIITIISSFIGLLISYIKFGNAWDKILVSFVLLLFGSIGLGFLGFGIIGRIRRAKTYDEIVDAVCVEVSREHFHSMDNNDGGPSYRPVFFVKCRNGHKYILYSNHFSNVGVPRVGDIIQLKLNSNNPFQWIRKNDFGSYAIFTIMGLGFTACGLGTYIWLLLSA